MSITSFIGPFPTDYSLPAQCSGYTRRDIIALDLAPSCLPDDFKTESTAYYSPGTACPSGYTAVESCTRSTDSVTTTVTCCPVRGDMTMWCVEEAASLFSVWTNMLCTWSAGETESVILYTSESGGSTVTAAETLSGGGGVNAYGLKMVFEASDLARSTSARPSRTTSTSAEPTAEASPARNTENTSGQAPARSSSAEASAQTSAPSRTLVADQSAGTEAGTVQGSSRGGSSSLGPGAIAAIAVVVPLVLIAALAGAWFWYRRRKQQLAYGTMPDDPKHPRPGPSAELTGSHAHPQELPSKPAVVELSGRPVVVMELPGDIPMDRMQSQAQAGGYWSSSQHVASPDGHVSPVSGAQTMSSSKKQPDDEHELDDDLLDVDDAAEEIADADGDDIAMDSDNEELVLHNDSIAFFDHAQDSLFAIAQHPLHPSLVAVGGSAGDADDAPGAGWLFDTSAARSRPVLPASFASDPSAAEQLPQSTQLDSLFALEGHTDSINALAWTLPRGDVLVSGGLDGRIRAWKTDVRPGEGVKVTLLGEAQEVPEVNWLAPCPSTTVPNTVALGASDGSVWIYTIDPSDPSDPSNPLQIVQSFFMHTMSSTAGAWTPDGKLLATVSEDGSLYVWDVWGGFNTDNGMSVVALTGEDQRFEVEGGLYSIAVDPKGDYVAVGGAGGAIKIVSLPRAGSGSQKQSRNRGGASDGGQILASLHTQSDSIETLAFSLASTTPPTTLLAAGSVDGSICVYDATRRFNVRRYMVGAHEDHSVVKLEFIKNSWTLTSCGMDGVVRRWDLRGGGSTTGQGSATSGADAGLVKEWKGHRGDGDGGGVLGFVQGETGERIVTAGDDAVALVFEA
ncbi:hypothetical protein S40288_06032 [Stachybotrys chartarum IBT 40288]|nr:hypothetical protein S40288_06032 [Stachybotrys chartarum IBT 40288]